MEVGAADIDDYEALPDTVSASTHMLAGAMAGIMEHCIMYPIDCVKTRMQALNPCPGARYSGMFNALYEISAKEGIRQTLRGITAVVGGAGPAHALYFACYEKLKWTFSQTKQGTALTNAAAGGCATLFHDAVMVPADVVKQRMQVYNSPYRSVWDCVTRVYKAEGARAFYRSYTTQMAMNVPFQGIHFMVYELAQNRMNHDRHYDPFSHVISGGVAGAAASALTNPLDVCKTLLNTQEACCKTGKPATMGLLEAARTIYRCHGIGGFYRGIQARIVFQVPATAISWSVYEFFKYFLTAAAAGDSSSR